MERGNPEDRPEGQELLADLVPQDQRRAIRRGERCRAPALGDHWDSELWKLEFSTIWRLQEPSNVVESRQVLLSLRHVCRSSKNWDHRVLLFTDNLCALAVFGKGRSSSKALRHILRRAAALSLCFGVRLVLRWVPSLRNFADGPSRGKPVGAPAPAPPRPQSSASPPVSTPKSRAYHC